MSNGKKQFNDYRKESRKNYGAFLEKGKNIDLEQVKVGAILRLADATENMAQDRQELLEEIDRLEESCKYLRRSRDRYRADCEYYARSRAAYMGLYKTEKAKNRKGEDEAN